MQGQSMLAVLSFLWILSLLPASAQPSTVWQDLSQHRAQFVTVEDGVQLEVLDWGGAGRPVVLLAGSGNTAHVFDDFAPKLTSFCHVYGITRRGYGASTQPASGYDDQRLADDVLRVLNSLSLQSPILIGHSMAGGEMTTLGSQHSSRLGGLVYLDALGDPRDWPGSDPAYMVLFSNLPATMRTRPAPVPAEESWSFEAFRARQMRNEGFAFPESELRNMYETRSDGTKGKHKNFQRIHNAIGAGQKKRNYTTIRVPVLALFEFPRPVHDLTQPGAYQPKNAEELAAIKAFNMATMTYVKRWTDNLRSGVPKARLVDLPGAGHYVFLTREADVLREVRTFIQDLP